MSYVQKSDRRIYVSKHHVSNNIPRNYYYYYYYIELLYNVTRSQSVIKRERVSKIQIPRFEETADHPSVHIFGAAAEKLKKLKTTPIKNRPSWRRDWAAFRGREAEEWRGEGNARERKR